ncbi:MAG: hypothetical protein OXI88_05195 [Gammaproteobacteria bacterium]|nr:hypothetical protein [Gammaproteobacteria bacterium]
MSIKPKDLVEYAHGMLQPEGREVEHRNMVNRAYYGAFLAARDLANITASSMALRRLHHWPGRHD